MTRSVLPLPLSLDLTQHTRWTVSQENALQTYPLAPEGGVEELDHDVVRVYLQFLWLPESIMPLSLFVPAVTCASTSPSPTSPHPLHALLEPLIMTPRAASSKYYVDLPQILVDGGGAGEIEENMMWFALSFEKNHTIGGSSHDAGNDESKEEEESEPWRDEKWRKGWLERMERREVQIQILLHFVKLSLPGPKPLDVTKDTSSANEVGHRSYLRRGHRLQKPTKPVPLSTADELEVYMDKMSMWQLMQGLETRHSASVQNQNKPSGTKDDDRDLIQIFVEDIVEKQFRPHLPDLCDLFHDKVFPTAPVSDTNDDTNLEVKSQPSTRSNSPVGSESASVFSHSVSAVSLKRKNALEHTTSLSRSRSLSVSLQQERESQRDATNQQKNKKRALNREVSMSRVFRAKSKGPAPGPGAVFGTAKGLGGSDKRQNYVKGKGKAVDETLVETTPVKNRIKAHSSTSAACLGGQLKSMALGCEEGGSADAEMDVDIWESELPKSRDVIMGAGDTDGDVVLVAETPRKVKPTTKAATRR